MESLIGIRANILYTKDKEEYQKYFEMVFLTNSANYSLSNEFDIVRSRAIKEQRVVISEKNLKEISYEYKFTKSETKLGMLMTLTDEQLNINIKKGIFK